MQTWCWGLELNALRCMMLENVKIYQLWKLQGPVCLKEDFQLTGFFFNWSDLSKVTSTLQLVPTYLYVSVYRYVFLQILSDTQYRYLYYLVYSCSCTCDISRNRRFTWRLSFGYSLFLIGEGRVGTMKIICFWLYLWIDRVQWFGVYAASDVSAVKAAIQYIDRSRPIGKKQGGEILWFLI